LRSPLLLYIISFSMPRRLPSSTLFPYTTLFRSYVYHLLDERLPDNSIVTADAGSTADWYGHHLKLRGDMRGNLSGSMASMLASMPYALAAKFAYPERPVICTIGDGAFQMLGMNEMFIVKRHWESWADPRFIVMILNNRDLTQVSWEMREEGDP